MSSAASPPTKRLACDRCHHKKIRCIPLSRDHKVCQRCQRQGLACNYSPPMKTGRPAHSNRMRRTNTAPSPAGLRHRSSQSFSVISHSQSLSMSPSPGTFPPAAPRTPSLDGSLHPTPVLTSPSEYAYPLFNGPVVVEPQSLMPMAFDSNDYFHDQTQGLLTPISYEGSCSPMTTVSSGHMPYLPLMTTEPMSYEADITPQPLNLEMHGLSLTETMNSLTELERGLPDRTPANRYNPDERMESLLRAADTIHSLLAPYFESGPHTTSVAQTIDSTSMSFMISIFNRVMEAFQAIVCPSLPPPSMPMRHARHLSVDTAPPSSRAVSPAVLQIHSPMPRHVSPMVQPTSSPYLPTSTPMSHGRSESSPVPFSTATYNSGPATSYGPIPVSLPSPGPLRLGREYESLDPELTKWVLANTLLWHVRNLSKLGKRIEVCLSFCATPAIAGGLEELGARINECSAHVQAIIDQLGEER